MSERDDPLPDATHLQLIATRLTVAFNIWAVVVGGSAGLIVYLANRVLTSLAEQQKQNTEYELRTIERVTKLEEHDKLSDAERQRNTAAIAELDRELNEHKQNGKK